MAQGSEANQQVQGWEKNEKEIYIYILFPLYIK
jgi:hypothetical protein